MENTFRFLQVAEELHLMSEKVPRIIKPLASVTPLLHDIVGNEDFSLSGC